MRDSLNTMKAIHTRDKETQDRLDSVFDLQANALKQKLLYKHYSTGELPFSSLNEIQIHENELATATTFNTSFQHLLDNDLYLENVYYEKDFSDSGTEYLSIKDIDDASSLSSKDRAVLLGTKAKMVLGISSGDASFFTLVPKKIPYFYSSYGNDIDNLKAYDFASMYRNRKLLKLDANTVYVQKPKGTSSNREFVKLIELVNLTGVHSLKNLPDFEDDVVVNELISNDFEGRILVGLGNNSNWRVLNEASSFILTDDGLYVMIPGSDSLTRLTFTNTEGIQKWLMGGFYTIDGEPTLILVARDRSDRNRIFYVSIESYPLLFDGNTIRELLGVDMDGVNDSPIGDIQQLIQVSDYLVATFSAGGFLEFNNFKYGFPVDDREFSESDTKTDIEADIHYLADEARLDMPFTGDPSRGSVKRISIDTLDATAISQSFINSAINLGNGALYWYSDSGLLKAKKFGSTDVSASWNFSPAGISSVSRNELVAVSTKLALFLKDESSDSSAKTLYGFIQKGKEYRYQRTGENWGWGVVSDNDGNRKQPISSVFNEYSCTFSSDGETLLNDWFDVVESTAESKVAASTAYTDFTSALSAIGVDPVSVSLKYVLNTDEWKLGKFACMDDDYPNVYTFRNFISSLADVEGVVDARLTDSTTPTATAYNMVDQSSDLAEQMTGMFLSKISGEIGNSVFSDLVKLNEDQMPEILPEKVTYTQTLQKSDVKADARSHMISLLSGISSDGLLSTTIEPAEWKNAIATAIAGSNYFSDWETYAIAKANYNYGNTSSDPVRPEDGLSVGQIYDAISTIPNRDTPPEINDIGFKLTKLPGGLVVPGDMGADDPYVDRMGNVKFTGNWSKTTVEEVEKDCFVATSTNAENGSTITFTVVRNESEVDGSPVVEHRVTDVSYYSDAYRLKVEQKTGPIVAVGFTIDPDEEGGQDSSDEDDDEEGKSSGRLAELKIYYGESDSPSNVEVFAQIAAILKEKYPKEQETDPERTKVYSVVFDDDDDVAEDYLDWKSSSAGQPAGAITVVYEIDESSGDEPDPDVPSISNIGFSFGKADGVSFASISVDVTRNYAGVSCVLLDERRRNVTGWTISHRVVDQSTLEDGTPIDTIEFKISSSELGWETLLGYALRVKFSYGTDESVEQSIVIEDEESQSADPYAEFNTTGIDGSTATIGVNLFAALARDGTPVSTTFNLSVVDYFGNPLPSGSSATASFSNGESSKTISSRDEEPESPSEQIDTISVVNNENIATTGNLLRVAMTFSYDTENTIVVTVPLNEAMDYVSKLSGQTFGFHSDAGVVIDFDNGNSFDLSCSVGVGEDDEEQETSQIFTYEARLGAKFVENQLAKIFNGDISRRQSAISNTSRYCAYLKLLKYPEGELTLPTYSNPSPEFPTPTLDNITPSASAATNTLERLLADYGSSSFNVDSSYYTLVMAGSASANDRYTMTGKISFPMQVSLSVYYRKDNDGQGNIDIKSVQNVLKNITVNIPFEVNFSANISGSTYGFHGDPTVTMEWAKSSVGWEDPPPPAEPWDGKIDFNTKLNVTRSIHESTSSKVSLIFNQNEKKLLGLDVKNFSKSQYESNDSIKSAIDNYILYKCGILEEARPLADNDILTMLLGPITDTSKNIRTITYSGGTTRNNRVNATLAQILVAFSDSSYKVCGSNAWEELNRAATHGVHEISGVAAHSVTINSSVTVDIVSNDDYKEFSGALDAIANRYGFTNPYSSSESSAQSFTDIFNRINNGLDEVKFSAEQPILSDELFVFADAKVDSEDKPEISLLWVDVFENLKTHVSRSLASSLYYSERKADNAEFFDELDPILDSLLKPNLGYNVHDKVMASALDKVNATHTRNFAKFDFVENQVPERMYCIKGNNEDADGNVDTIDDAKIFGVVGRKAMTFTESGLCSAVSDARIYTERQAFTPVPYEVKSFPFDIVRWEPANTSCSEMVYWLNVPYIEGTRTSNEYDIPTGIYPYMDDDGIVGFFDAIDQSGQHHPIISLVYSKMVGRVFFAVEDSCDIYAVEASKLKLRQDRVYKINLSVDCIRFKTRYSGNPNKNIAKMFLSDRNEAKRSADSFNGNLNLVVQFDDASKSVHRFTFTNELESVPYAPIALSNAFADGNLAAAYRQFSGTTINDISATDSGIAVFTGDTYYAVEDGYANKEDAVLYPTILKTFTTADSVYGSYYLNSNLVLTCVSTSGPLQEMYPYHQISLTDMVPELLTLVKDNLIVYDVDMTSWSSETTMSYIIVYTNKGVYLIDMGMSPGRLKYDDKQAVIDYFTTRAKSGIGAHLTSKHHDRSILTRFNNWRRKIADNTVYDFVTLTTNTEYTSPTERHGGNNDNENVSVVVDKQVFGSGTVICAAEQNPGVVFAAVQSPITKYDSTWQKTQLASPLVDTRFYDYFYKKDTAPNGSTLLSGMLNLNHLPFIYRFNTDKTWDMWVNIPSTMTPYMNRVVGSAANIKGGRVKVEGNLAKMRKNLNNVGLISDPTEQSTIVRLYVNTSHFHIDSITDAEISGSSLPMYVYRDADANDGLFDGVQMQSVWNRQIETVVDKHGVSYAMLEFRVWGADEQSVRLHGGLANKIE